jgi:hypothetical protein
MATIKFKRGLESARSGVTPAAGEPLWTTDDKKLYIGDGSTAGGIPVGGGGVSTGSTAPSSTPSQVGELYVDTTSGIAYIATGTSSSADWDQITVAQAYTRTTYTATASQTTFSATYTVGYVDVYLNGVKLIVGTDFTATNGTSIVFTTGAAAGDSVEIIAFETFNLASVANVVADTTPQLGGLLDLNSKGLTIELTAGDTVAAGDICYINSSGDAKLVDADAASTCNGQLVMAQEAITATNAGTFFVYGVVEGFSGLTPGTVYYASTAGTTGNTYTTTAPSATGDVVRKVFSVLTSTTIFFNPSADYAEIP